MSPVIPNSSDSSIPALRRVRLNGRERRPDGDYVLYWMIAHRRTSWNFALDRAVEMAVELNRPLWILEPLRCGYSWASDRMHRFIIDGMVDNARSLNDSKIGYYAYLEERPGEGSGLLERLAAKACAVVTDEFPCFFLPRMVTAVAERLDVYFEAVDSNGLLPLRASSKAFKRAVDFRRYLQKTLPKHLLDAPLAELDEKSLVGAKPLPTELTDRWPNRAAALVAGEEISLEPFDIDHSVPPVSTSGGTSAALERLDRFLDERLRRYVDDRMDLGSPATSELSPHLHFGHISSHQMFQRLAKQQDWTPDQLSEGPYRGQREGWWGMDGPAESFLDELVTWRELSYNGAFFIGGYDRYDTLPEWARISLAQHADDPRPHVYDLATLEEARTHDEIWNAAQRQLVQEGIIHNYLRMLWGKKILHWTKDPRQALDFMVELNNKYALDGRDPNSYSGIFWVLGRYDRAWGPERPIFGKIRYMTSDSTRRKVKMGDYLERFGEPEKRSGKQLTLGD